MDNMQTLIKPKSIKPGSTVAFIAPAGPINEEKLKSAQIKLETMGFHVKFTDRILNQKGYLAGDDNSRLEDFHAAFTNKEIDFILCIRGGYGSSRIVDKIDFTLIKNNPKIFIGFSDITVLLNSIWQKTGLVTFHGVVGNSNFSDYTRQQFLSILSSKTPGYEIDAQNPDNLGYIHQGIASGKLVGGNLSLIISLLATEYEIDFTNKLVFIEDIDEAPYKIDRMLTQLILAGKLQKAAGIILGEFKGCDIDNLNTVQKNSLSLSDVLCDRLGGLNIPVLTGFSFGHVDHQAVFPIGIMAELDTNKPYIKLLENVVD
jgi:muramoyltetrapeptide carboxypeptidase